MKFRKRLKRFPFLAVMVAVSLLLTAAVIFLQGDKRRTGGDGVADGPAARLRKITPLPEGPRRFPERERRGVRIAVIIDDIGFDLHQVKLLARTKAPIAFAVLPNAPHAADAARLLHEAGKEILLHLPMEPRSYPAENPGEGALFTRMTAAEIRGRLAEQLRAVPYAAGVNNHMGSLFMEWEEGLTVVMEELARRNLYFIDSRTTPNSLGRTTAARAGVRFAERAVFIDHERGYRAALANLVHPHRWDWEKGKPLLLIGHPFAETMSALTSAQSRWEEAGMEVIPPSMLVGPPDGKERGKALARYW